MFGHITPRVQLQRNLLRLINSLDFLWLSEVLTFYFCNNSIIMNTKY